MIEVGNIVKFKVIYGQRLGRVVKIETHRGLHQYDIACCDADPEPAFAPRWMPSEDFHVMSDSDLVLWKLENA